MTQDQDNQDKKDSKQISASGAEKPKRGRPPKARAATESVAGSAPAEGHQAEAKAAPKRRAKSADASGQDAPAPETPAAKKPRAPRSASATSGEASPSVDAHAEAKAAPKRGRPAKKAADAAAPAADAPPAAKAKVGRPRKNAAAPKAPQTVEAPQPAPVLKLEAAERPALPERARPALEAAERPQLAERARQPLPQRVKPALPASAIALASEDGGRAPIPLASAEGPARSPAIPLSSADAAPVSPADGDAPQGARRSRRRSRRRSPGNGGQASGQSGNQPGGQPNSQPREARAVEPAFLAGEEAFALPTGETRSKRRRRRKRKTPGSGEQAALFQPETFADIYPSAAFTMPGVLPGLMKDEEDDFADDDGPQPALPGQPTLAQALAGEEEDDEDLDALDAMVNGNRAAPGESPWPAAPRDGRDGRDGRDSRNRRKRGKKNGDAPRAALPAIPDEALALPVLAAAVRERDAGLPAADDTLPAVDGIGFESAVDEAPDLTGAAAETAAPEAPEAPSKPGRPAKSGRGARAAAKAEAPEARPARDASSKRTLYVSVVPDEQVEVVITENGMVTEYFVEMAHQAKIRGNIYKGVISNVDTNLQAAFVNFGSGKNGFLQIDEVHPEYWLTHHDAARGPKYPPIQKVLKSGQEVLVQVVKEPAGTKGAFLTTWISMAGRFLVLTPGQEQIGVSRKVEDPEERARLKELLNGIQPGEDTGVIIRTASEGASKTSIQKDLQYLKRLWKDIRKRGMAEKAPALIYQEANLAARAVRDYLAEDIHEIWVDNENTLEAIRETTSLLYPRRPDMLKLHRDPRQTLWERFNLQRQLEEVTSREVVLPSGGRLVFDQTEALMAIDINSGKTQGKSNFEAMVFRTNMEAAEAIARHLRLRDIGGQVVIDFIEMRDRAHCAEVEKTLRNAMRQDRARHDVGRMSSFGLLELVRQRTGTSAISISSEPCPHCHGTGVRRNMEWQALQTMRDLQRKLVKLVMDARSDPNKAPKTQTFVYETEAELALYLLNKKRDRLGELETKSGFHIEIRPK